MTLQEIADRINALSFAERNKTAYVVVDDGQVLEITCSDINPSETNEDHNTNFEEGEFFLIV